MFSAGFQHIWSRRVRALGGFTLPTAGVSVLLRRPLTILYPNTAIQTHIRASEEPRQTHGAYQSSQYVRYPDKLADATVAAVKD